uniref:(northern house mosquito) hypothetical protein n=1 Tax=Culex pipiens TaxID=7175 RepID=A0A8D8H7F2_CULPI
MILKRWSSTNRILVYCILLNGELLNYVMSNKSVIYLIDHVHVPTRYCLFKLQVQYYSRQHPFWRLPATSNPTVQLVNTMENMAALRPVGHRPKSTKQQN